MFVAYNTPFTLGTVPWNRSGLFHGTVPVRVHTLRRNGRSPIRNGRSPIRNRRSPISY